MTGLLACGYIAEARSETPRSPASPGAEGGAKPCILVFLPSQSLPSEVLLGVLSSGAGVSGSPGHGKGGEFEGLVRGGGVGHQEGIGSTRVN